MSEYEQLNLTHQIDQATAALIEKAESTLEMKIEGDLLKTYLAPGMVAVDAAIAYLDDHDQPGLDRDTAWGAFHEVVLERVQEAKREDPNWLKNLIQEHHLTPYD